MPQKDYHQFCAIARAMDLVGDRWTLLILRDLMLGPLRYKELHDSLKPITTNLLAERLQYLENQGLIRKERVEGRHHVYHLIDPEQRLRRALFYLGAWGARFLPDDIASCRYSIRWSLFQAIARLRPLGRAWSIQFETGEQSYFLREQDGEVHAGVGALPEAKTKIQGPEIRIVEILERPGPDYPRGLKISGERTHLDAIFQG